MAKERMTREEILIDVKKYFQEEKGLESNEVQESSLLIEDLGLDSLDLAEMGLDLEEKFRVAIPDEKAKKMATVGNVVDCLVEAQKENYINEGSGDR